MTYDDLLHKIGDFGTYQKRIYFFLCLPAMSCALYKLAGVFILAKADHRYWLLSFYYDLHKYSNMFNVLFIFILI